VVIVEHTWVDQVKQALAQAETDMLTAAISADISEQLDAGHDVAYSAIASEQSFAVARLAAGEDLVEGGQVLVDDSGVYGERFLATKDGFAVVAMEATDQGVAIADLSATAAEGDAEPGQEAPKPAE
jgi:hypothetical protein